MNVVKLPSVLYFISRLTYFTHNLVSNPQTYRAVSINRALRKKPSSVLSGNQLIDNKFPT